MVDPWLTDRTYTWLYELLTPGGRLVRTLRSASGFGWTYDLNADTRGTGTLTVQTAGASSSPLDQVDDWELYRLRVSHVLYPGDGSSAIVTPVAYAIPVAPRGASPRRPVRLTLLDVSNALVTCKPRDTVAYPAGYSVALALAEQLALALVPKYAVTATDAVLRTDMSWPPDTRAATIVNAIGDVAGFAGARADLDRVVLEPYVAPAARPISMVLRALPGEGITDPDWTVAEDDRPNRLVCTATTTGTETSAAQVWSTYREDVADAAARNRWITETRNDVQAADLTTFTAYVDNLWSDLRAPKETLTIRHLFDPRLWGNVNIMYRDVVWTITNQALSADSPLITTTARRVA